MGWTAARRTSRTRAGLRSAADLDLANIGSTSTGSGAGAGKADFSPLNVVLPHEAGLAALMDFAATGEHVKGVRIEGIAAGAKSSTTVYDLTLANVLVTKVADAEGDGYSLSLDYSKIALVTQGIDDAGKISQNGAFGFDRTAGNAFDPLSLAPIDITSGPLSINENSANGTLVGTLTGQDPDNQALAYTLTHNATGRFAIDNAGHVTVENGVLLDFEQNASHTIGVRVTDSDAWSSTSRSLSQ